MSSTPHDSETERIGAQTESFGSAGNATPPETLVSGAVGDRCVSCGAPLSSDQRYCVVCGERRGAPRFTLPPAAPEVAPATTVVARPAAGGGRFSSGTTLVAGVATLLLAMLVGVLIGHNTAGSGTRTVASAPVRIITTGGGSSSSGASTSGSASGGVATTAKPSTSKSTAKTGKKTTPKAVKKTAKAETGAASKVLGGKTPPATVTVGSTGTGKGYSKKTHKFTGSFFGQ